MKKIMKIILWAVVVVVIGLVAAYFARNWLVERAIEAGCTYALGVDTNLGSAGLDIGGGNLKLHNLEISNPQGFEARKFLSLRSGVFALETGSVFEDEVVVDSLVIEGVTLNLEQVDKKGNYLVLLDNIRKVDLSAFSSEKESRYRIGLVALRDIKVAGSLSLLGKKFDKSFSVEDFSLRNVGSDKGATIGQITSEIVKALVSRALVAGSGVFPGGFGKTVSDLKDRGVETIKSEVTSKVQDLGKSLTGGKK